MVGRYLMLLITALVFPGFGGMYSFGFGATFNIGTFFVHISYALFPSMLLALPITIGIYLLGELAMDDWESVGIEDFVCNFCGLKRSNNE